MKKRMKTRPSQKIKKLDELVNAIAHETFNDAIETCEKRNWQKAMDAEITTLKENGFN